MDRLTRRGTHNGLNGFWVKEINGTESFMSWKNDCYEGIAKLVHYEDLEEQGRLVELPCKVGDTVYAIEGNDIVKNKVTEIWFNTDGRYVFTKEVIAKTVFLTKEEAEAKLAEEGSGSDETD